jgi:hypothetical protein
MIFILLLKKNILIYIEVICNYIAMVLFYDRLLLIIKFKMELKMKRKIPILFAILLSNSLYSETYNKNQINEFECSPEEMAQVLERKGDKRIQQTTYKDFTKPYQEAVIMGVANDITEETGVETKPENLTQEQLKDAGADLSCLNVDFSKMGENIMEEIDTLKSLLSGELSEASNFIDEVMADLSKGFCSKALMSAADYVSGQVGEIGKRAQRELESKVRDQEFSKILDKKGREYLINDQIEETFGDKSKLLKWRDGEIDKNNFKSKVGSIWGDELDDLYDDFDDQVDESIDN